MIPYISHIIPLGISTILQMAAQIVTFSKIVFHDLSIDLGENLFIVQIATLFKNKANQVINYHKQVTHKPRNSLPKDLYLMYCTTDTGKRMPFKTLF